MPILPDTARGGNDQVHISSGISACRGRLWGSVLLVFLCLALAAQAPAADSDVQAVAQVLRQRLGELRSSGRLELQGVVLGREDILVEFYARRGYQPAWEDPARVAGLRLILEQAAEHGLNPEDFFSSRLATLVPSLARSPAGGAGLRADIDLLLTEALIRYGYQRRFGKVDPARMEPAWNFRRGFTDDQADPVALLAEAVSAPSLQGFLDSHLPGSPWYRQLQIAYARYRSLSAAGGWPSLADGPTLRSGERDARVAVLRERLQIEGGLPADIAVAEDPELFDQPLAAALMQFQERHALARDGVVGAQTRAALNVPAQARMNQLRLSLERVRWLTGDVPQTYVVVNIAGFRAGFVRDHRLIWSTRVVVGRTVRQTPIFMGRMTWLELNPTWTIPPTILRQDVLPRLRHDPGYLVRENIIVLDRNGRPVDPGGVDWAAQGRNPSLILRQEPGPANSLGRIKFMFPNQYAVYLHDTPAKALFGKPERDFSSGCIRVEDPLALAELVLNDPQWDRAAVEAAIDTGATRRITLKAPIPVLLVYLTAVADATGSARFYRDIYRRDDALLAALDGPVQLALPAARPAAADRKRGVTAL